jgi:hypothetical protein
VLNQDADMKKLAGILTLAATLVGCTHTQVLVKDSADERLTCMEIATQTAEAKGVLRDIDDKTGFSGRNVAMGIFFWPGIIVNQMNAGDARKAATERLAVLADLAKQRSCQ